MPGDFIASEELETIANLLSVHFEHPSIAAVKSIAVPIVQASRDIGLSWSGSFLGYHALVYYEGFRAPPAGAHFSSEWGLMRAMQGSKGDWREYTAEDIEAEIKRRSREPDLTKLYTLSEKAGQALKKAKPEIVSILEVEAAGGNDAIVNGALAEAKEIRVFTVDEYSQAMVPSGQKMSRDSTAISQGIWVGPHLRWQAQILAVESAFEGCGKLAEICKRVSSHLFRKGKRKMSAKAIGTNVFIGHGRSTAWRDLKDFIHERLKLPYDEFNRVPVAGITNISRLTEMLEAASIAFVVMTGEDEQADGGLHARMNVIHEVGLFQGKLGFTKAIVLLEETCKEFSNIQGLGQIRFPTGNIKAVFDDIRRVLEREGVIKE